MKSNLEIQLRYSDTDQMGVIYHANYFSFYEQARTNFLKELGYDYHEIERNGIIFPIREVSNTYLKSIRYGEKITVSTILASVSKIKITYYHEIHNSEGELKSKGYTTVVCVDKETFQVVKMDERLPKIYQKYQDLMVKDS
ncbi:MAG: acyl-CoA thioesterase [Firmicutes bacterium]|nr:acyl-CoA thioesterase [Bacillota bacterium]